MLNCPENLYAVLLCSIVLLHCAVLCCTVFVRIQFKRTDCQNKKQYCTVMYCLCMVLYCMQSFAANFRTRNRPFVPGSHPGSGSGQSSHAQGGYCTVLHCTTLYCTLPGNHTVMKAASTRFSPSSLDMLKVPLRCFLHCQNFLLPRALEHVQCRTLHSTGACGS